MRVSNSGIQCFKACRRLYELKYKYGLEPVQTADALKRGLQYHDLVEGLLNGELKFRDCDDVKVKAMATAFQMYIMPTVRAEATEQWFSYNTKSGHTVIGRIDGVTYNNEVIEHKTISGSIDGEYFSKLQMDEQIPTYMLACGSNFIWYTVCATPTIRQRKNESDEEFYMRCVEWFAEDTEHKITCVEMYRSKEELAKFAEEQDAVISEMENCKLFYRNQSNCMKWGRLCEYASVCMNYDPNQDYIQFKRRESCYEKAGETEVRKVDSEQADVASGADEADH